MEQRLRVPGQFSQLARIASFVTDAARAADLSDDDVFHVEMAVDEACSNIIEHAYADNAGDITLTCTSPAPGLFEVTIHDTGRPFDPAAVILPEVSAPITIDDVTEGGLGLYFMRKLMDEVRFEMGTAQGNTLYMSKHRA